MEINVPNRSILMMMIKFYQSKDCIYTSPNKVHWDAISTYKHFSQKWRRVTWLAMPAIFHINRLHSTKPKRSRSMKLTHQSPTSDNITRCWGKSILSAFLSWSIWTIGECRNTRYHWLTWTTIRSKGRSIRMIRHSSPLSAHTSMDCNISIKCSWGLLV